MDVYYKAYLFSKWIITIPLFFILYFQVFAFIFLEIFQYENSEILNVIALTIGTLLIMYYLYLDYKKHKEISTKLKVIKKFRNGVDLTYLGLLSIIWFPFVCEAGSCSGMFLIPFLPITILCYYFGFKKINEEFLSKQ